MIRLTNKFIYEKLGEADLIEFEPQFSLKDLEGKTIKKHRQIKYKKFREPRKSDKCKELTKGMIEGDIEDPHFYYHYSPEHLDIIIFLDDTFLATELRGNGECGHLGCYYFNGRKTLYSDRLFRI